MEQQKKFYVAMAIYAAIGFLIWMTIDNIPLPFSAVHLTLRQLTLGILGLFVLRTVLRSNLVGTPVQHEKVEAKGLM